MPATSKNDARVFHARSCHCRLLQSQEPLIIRINGAIGLALFCAVETIMLAYPGTMAGKIAETAAPYLGICATIYISNIIATAKSGLTKLLTTISGSLYIVYLFHTTFEGLAKAIMDKIPYFDGYDTAAFIIGCIIVITCGTVLPVVTHRLILDKARITRFLFGLK